MKAWGRMIIYAIILFTIHRKFGLKMVLVTICISSLISHSKAEPSTVLKHLQNVLTYVLFRNSTSWFFYNGIDYANLIKTEATLVAIIEN
jgi:hypothetical protein